VSIELDSQRLNSGFPGREQSCRFRSATAITMTTRTTTNTKDLQNSILVNFVSLVSLVLIPSV
jgi:hypothetical protein